MNPWWILAFSILAETAGTICLKLSDGLGRPVPVAAMALLYVVAVWLMGLATRRLEVGVAYAVWGGAGTALVAVIGIYVFDESLYAAKIMGIMFIVIGIILLNLGHR